MKRQQKNKKSGFTLVELVVVIAIIGILAAVVVPRVRVAIYKARDAKAISVVDAIRTASNIYFIETGSSISAKWEGLEANAKAKSALTYADIEKLKTKALLDEKTLKLVAIGTTGSAITTGAINVEVGSSVAAIEDCEKLTKGYLPIFIADDGVDVIIDSKTYDASCNLWSEK